MTAIQNQNSHNDLSTAAYGQARHRDYDMAILPWGATRPSQPPSAIPDRLHTVACGGNRRRRCST